LLVPRIQKWSPVALGALAGLMTLARSDGLLWLGLAGLVVMWKSSPINQVDGKPSFTVWLSRIVPAGSLVLAGYLVVMGPWHYRSLTMFHSFLTPGGGKVLWLRNYRETFIYPASLLTSDHLLQVGWYTIFQDRLAALGSNLLTAIFAQGGILLLPFICMGLWRLRNDLLIKLGLTGWLITYLVLSVVFPYAGARGSFHHAGAALQPLFWAVAPIGMDTVLEWARRKGQFADHNAPYVFQGLLVLWAILLTGFLVNIRVVESGWARDDVIYPSVEAKLQKNGISPRDVVIVPNPPGYYVRTGRSAVRLPTGDEATVLDVAEKFHAKYLVLEKSDALGELQDLYNESGGDPSFVYLGEVEGARLYRVINVP